MAARADERFAVRARELGLALRVEADGYAVVLADPDRLLQAVSNLVENALRVTPAGGTVVVRVFPGRIEVADNGPGLEASDLPHAFDRFYLHDRYRSDRPVGSGLGLALVRELAEAMGGKVSVVSAPGKGTAFAIDLQLSQPSAAATRSLQRHGVERLGDHPGHAQRRVARQLARLGLGGHEQHRDRARLVAAAQDVQRRRAVQPRHHHVEQDHVGLLRGRELDAVGAAACRQHLPARHRPQRELHDLADVGLVVDEQDGAAAHEAGAASLSRSATRRSNSSGGTRPLVKNRVLPSVSRCRSCSERSRTV